MSNSYDELSDDAPTRSRGFSLPSVRFFSLPEAITSENPYMSSIFYSFTIAALLSSCAFSMWEFYLYQQNFDNFEKDVPVWQCDAPAILKAILSSAVFNLVLVAGSIIAGFVGIGITFSNYLNKSQLLRTLRIAYLSFQIIVSLIIIILGIIVSVFLWGTYCRGDGRLRHCSSCVNYVSIC
jgi:uncharacterized integral membrane protein